MTGTKLGFVAAQVTSYIAREHVAFSMVPRGSCCDDVQILLLTWHSAGRHYHTNRTPVVTLAKPIKSFVAVAKSNNKRVVDKDEE